MTLYLPVGPPGCGKTTLAQAMIDAGIPIAVVSPDTLRGVLTGDVADQSESAAAFKIAHEITAIRLNHGLDVYFDATNLSVKRLPQAPAGTPIVTIWFNVPFETLLANNAGRDRQVPWHVVRRFYDRWAALDPSMFPGTIVDADLYLTRPTLTGD